MEVSDTPVARPSGTMVGSFAFHRVAGVRLGSKMKIPKKNGASTGVSMECSPRLRLSRSTCVHQGRCMLICTVAWPCLRLLVPGHLTTKHLPFASCSCSCTRLACSDRLVFGLTLRSFLVVFEDGIVWLPFSLVVVSSCPWSTPIASPLLRWAFPLRSTSHCHAVATPPIRLSIPVSRRRGQP